MDGGRPRPAQVPAFETRPAARGRQLRGDPSRRAPSVSPQPPVLPTPPGDSVRPTPSPREASPPPAAAAAARGAAVTFPGRAEGTWGMEGVGRSRLRAARSPRAPAGTRANSPGGWRRPPGRPLGVGRAGAAGGGGRGCSPSGRRRPPASPPHAPAAAAPGECGARGARIPRLRRRRRGATQASERAAAGAAASSSMAVYPAALWEFDLRRRQPPP